MISTIGLGTWQWGSREWGWGRLYTEKDLRDAFQRGYELGINFVDTAEIYGHGKSEEILGRVIHDHRDEIVIATKVSPWNLTYNRLLRAADGSLRRLNVDVIDLLQIHWPNRFVPLASTMRAMKKLVEKGKVRYVGVSNFNASQMKAAQEALSPLELASNQVKFNLLDRKIEDNLLQAATRDKITIIAYSPLAKGLLTGKYTPQTPPSSLVQKVSPRFSRRNQMLLTDLQQVIKKMGNAHQRTPSQVVLNWLICRQNVIAIPGAKRPSDVSENAGATGWRLSEDEIDVLERTARINFDKLSGLRNLISALLH